MQVIIALLAFVFLIAVVAMIGYAVGVSKGRKASGGGAPTPRGKGSSTKSAPTENSRNNYFDGGWD